MLGLIALYLLYMVQTIHRSCVINYWVNIPVSFKNPKALIDDKTGSLHKLFKKLTMEFLVRNTKSYYQLFPWRNKPCLAHITAAFSAFRVDSGLGLLSSVCGFHLVVESGSFGFYHLPEERSRAHMHSF